MRPAAGWPAGAIAARVAQEANGERLQSELFFKALRRSLR